MERLISNRNKIILTFIFKDIASVHREDMTRELLGVYDSYMMNYSLVQEFDKLQMRRFINSGQILRACNALESVIGTEQVLELATKFVTIWRKYINL